MTEESSPFDIKKIVNPLRQLGEISMIIHYGSSLKGAPDGDSDIDIALIIDDSLRGMPLNIEGYPLGLMEKVRDALQDVGYPIHTVMYYKSGFDNGILLDDGRGNPNMLNDVGRIIYNAYEG